MSKFDDALEKYGKVLTDLGVEYDAALLRAITKGLGPSIYNADAAHVACTDKDEVARVKNNFLIKKLGLEDGEALDTAMKEMCETMKSIRLKPRAVMCYLFVKKFGKESIYA